MYRLKELDYPVSIMTRVSPWSMAINPAYSINSYKNPHSNKFKKEKFFITLNLSEGEKHFASETLPEL